MSWKNSTTFYVKLILLLMATGMSNVMAETGYLGSGDIVKITVYGQSDLTTIVRINPGGKISFPLIGEVRVSGLSIRQAEAKIAELLLSRGIVKSPQVNIFLEQQKVTVTNSITILGEVTKPGKYSVEGPESGGIESIIDLLALAGGTNSEAADHLILIKNKDKKSIKKKIDLVALLRFGDLTQNSFVRGGDIVFVPKMDVFYIYGEVQNPGRYRLERNMTVLQALSVGGGLTPRGTEKGMLLKRHNGNNKVESMNANPLSKLMPNDVLYIKESLF